jgi:putative tricarboxylic transport membrane protein
MDLLVGFQIVLLNPINLGLLILGSLIGILFGLLPGITVLTALTLIIPVTYGMDIAPAVILMIGTYCSGLYGGSLTSILFKIPGDPQNAATTFDGYPMTRKGQASEAIGAGLMAAVIGGLLSTVALIVFAPQLLKVALSFGPAEHFGLIFFALSMVAVLNTNSVVKGTAAVLFGMLIGTVGVAPETGIPRFTFGYDNLLGGIDFVPVLLGIFAISEVLDRIHKGEEEGQTAFGDPSKLRLNFLSLKKWFELKWILLRSSFIGIFFGFLPGLGATLASFFAYDIEKSLSKKSDQFGKGIVEGVVPPEAACNASSGGGMILLVSLGIPGTVASAIILGAFHLHGIQVGAFFFKREPVLLNTIFAAFVIANLMMIPVAYVALKTMVRFLNVRFELLAPIIVAFCVVGAYSVRNNYMDVIIMFGAGILGYLMLKYDFPIAVLVLGNILGPLLEEAFSRAMITAHGNFFIFLFQKSYLSAGTFACGLLMWAIPVVQYVQRRRRKNRFASGANGMK